MNRLNDWLYCSNYRIQAPFATWELLVLVALTFICTLFRLLPLRRTKTLMCITKTLSHCMLPRWVVMSYSGNVKKWITLPKHLIFAIYFDFFHFFSWNESSSGKIGWSRTGVSVSSRPMEVAISFLQNNNFEEGKLFVQPLFDTGIVPMFSFPQKVGS